MAPEPAEDLRPFFAQAPRIRVRDPLAAFLGAARDGVLEYGYADAVRLAGHSCPTVASAWLMARAALHALYGAALPERGSVRVELRDQAEEGVTGVIANVFALVTGATVNTGFKGIGGRFDRRAPHHLAAVARRAFVRVEICAHGGVDAVGADEQIGTLGGQRFA